MIGTPEALNFFLFDGYLQDGFVDFSAAYQWSVSILREKDDKRTGRYGCVAIWLIIEKHDILFGVITLIDQLTISRRPEAHFFGPGYDVLYINVLAVRFEFRFRAAPAGAFANHTEQAVTVDLIPVGWQFGQTILSEERKSFFECRVHVVIVFSILKQIEDNMISFHLYFGLLMSRTR
jgi:hypothetical protein